LRNALRNKNGFIRAQAAAVASRLSIDEKSRLWSTATPGANDGEEAAVKSDTLDVGARRP
jgi:hypothetical protein